MSVDVSVVIVTYNSRDDIDACLTAVRETTSGIAYEAIVVDNASRDGTTQIVRDAHPWARVIPRTINIGLSGAINEGVAASSGRHVMALNPDARLCDDVLATLAAYLDDHADTGVVAPKILDDDGTLQLSCRAFPSHATAIFSRYSLATRLFPGNRYSRDYLMSDFGHDQVRDVDWVSGAAMMFPRSVFDRLGGWDAGFFMFNEDVDFCRRVHDAGFRVVYNPAVAVYHRIGVSKRAPARIVIERHKSMWRYYRKHMRGNRLVDAATAAGIAVRCGSVLASGVVRGVATRVRG
ncbi:MAG: glycosyltransferase family 2 protein [Dehalococcoidia bacterium]